jgi:hypothetical protein
VLLSVCAIPAILVVIPTIYTLHLALGLSLPEGLMLLLALMLGLLVPHFNFVAREMTSWRSFIAATSVLGVVLLGAAIYTGGYRADRPKSNSLFYGLNADTGTAVWASSDASPDRWTSKYLDPEGKPDRLYDFFPLGSGEYLNGPAPVSPLPAPNVTVLKNVESNGVRILHLKINSMREAPIIEITNDNDVRVLMAECNGKRVTLINNIIVLRHFGAPEDGIDLAISAQATEPLKLRIADYTYGIAKGTGLAFEERPESAMPSRAQIWKQNSVAVSKSYTF